MKDEDPTPEEQREAEALARALAGDPTQAAAPQDVLETAALLRSVRADARLDPARAAAVLARARPRALRRRPPIWAGLTGAVAVAVVVLVLLRTRPVPPPWPAPSAELLEAQAAVAGGGAGALERLDTGMRGYRQALFTRLGARSGETR
jgi:hypothetical protein